MIRLMNIALPAVVAIALAACSNSDNNDDTAGTLQLSVADAPIDDASAVVVRFTGVELKPAEGESYVIDFDTPREVNLLTTANGQAFVLLDKENLPAGDYNWVRLKVLADVDTTDSYIELEDGSRYPLYVPSGSESGLKLNNPFSIPAGGVRAVVVDFDLRHSIVKPEGQDAYMLKPVLRIVDESQVGEIAGTVDAALLDAPLCSANPATGDGAAVYLYQDAVTAPDDAGGEGAEPMASARLMLDEDSGEFRYTLAWLPPGDYTVAHTCQAGDDQPETDEAITFNAIEADVEVTAGNTTEVRLSAPANAG